MSHRDTCPDPRDAEREGRRAQERGLYRNPYDGRGGSDESCEEAAQAWRTGLRRAEAREEEQREEEAARQHDEMRRAELEADDYEEGVP